MSNYYPTQIRTIDPYSEYNSNVINRLTSMLSKNTDCILSNYPIDVTNNLDDGISTNTVTMSHGMCIKDNVLLEIYETIIDFEDSDFYVSGTPIDEEGYYLILLEYEYLKARPARKVSIKILKPSQYDLYDESLYFFIKSALVINNDGNLEVASVHDSVPSTTIQRVYTQSYLSLENTLPTFSNGDNGRIIYVRDEDNVYVGIDGVWREIALHDYICDTSGCTVGDLAYIGSLNIAYPATSGDTSTFSTCSVISIDSLHGLVRIIGLISSSRVQTGITLSSGDLLYLSSTEAGTVTNIRQDSNFQIIGRCIDTTGSDYVCILAPLLGASGGTYIHNLMENLQGGNGTDEFYHLDSTSYSVLIAFGGNHNNIPYGLQGGSSAERYHLTESEHDYISDILNDNTLWITPLKSYILSMLSYKNDDRNIHDKFNLTINSENSPIGDAISGEGIGDAAICYTNSSYADEDGTKYFGLFGSIVENYFRSRTGSMAYAVSKAASISLTNDIGLIAGGQNTNTVVISSSQSLSDSADTWTQRTSLTTSRNFPNGLSISTDSGCIVGGYNSTTFYSKNEQYAYSTNTWTTKTLRTNTLIASAEITLSATWCGLLAGGCNTSYSPSVKSELYNSSTDAWSAAEDLTIARYYSVGISLFKYSGIISGGRNSYSYIANTDLYQASEDTWTSKESLPGSYDCHTSISLNSNFGIISGREETSYAMVALRYNYGSDSWDGRVPCDSYTEFPSGISFTSDTGTVAGGMVPTAVSGLGSNTYLSTAWKYKDIGSISRTFGFKNISTLDDQYLPIHHIGDNFVIETRELTNYDVSSQPAHIITSALYNLPDSESDITYDISMGGSNSLTGQTLDEFVDISTLDPSDDGYKLSLKFNLIRGSGVNTWTTRSSGGLGVHSAPSFKINSRDSIIGGGTSNHNGSGYLRPENVYNFSDDENTWSSRTSLPSEIYDGLGIYVDYDHGLISGGCNAGGYVLGSCVSYSYNSNAWYNRSDMTVPKHSHSGFRFTNDTLFSAYGSNGATNLITSHTYSYFQDVWTSKTSVTNNLTSSGAANFTTDLGLFSGGKNYSSGIVTYVRCSVYTLSSDSWTSKPTTLLTRDYFCVGSLTYDLALMSGGQNSSGDGYNRMDVSELFSYSGNLWTARDGLSTIRSRLSQGSSDTNTSIVLWGELPYSPYSQITSAEKYTHGEVSFIGFSSMIFMEG